MLQYWYHANALYLLIKLWSSSWHNRLKKISDDRRENWSEIIALMASGEVRVGHGTVKDYLGFWREI